MKQATPEQRRRSLLAKIHMAAKSLGMADDTYRDMLQMVTGKRSAGELNAGDLARVMSHLLRLGFTPKRKKVGNYPGRPNPPISREAMIGKIEALLADAQRPWAYADGMARHMFKVDKVDWCTGEQLHKLIAALEYDKKRRGK